MRAWADRLPEAAALLNPALLAAISAAAASQHEQVSRQAMPWPLTFLVAPLVPRRAQELAEFVREGLRFGMIHGALEVTGGGQIRSSLPFTRPVEGGDTAEIIRSAGLAGRWFAKADQPATLFALLGVAP